MTKEQRAETEASADRLLRRGELSEALALYQQLVSSFPDDPALERKLRELDEMLQPAELTSGKTSFRALAETPEAHAEHLFAKGDHAGALAAYRRALKARPDNELVRERLAELFRIAQASPQKPPAARLPKEPTAMLAELLDRISSRRRG